MHSKLIGDKIPRKKGNKSEVKLKVEVTYCHQRNGGPKRPVKFQLEGCSREFTARRSIKWTIEFDLGREGSRAAMEDRNFPLLVGFD